MSTTTTSDQPFIVTRTFDAPRQLVWDAWTKAEHLKSWFGPKGSETTAAKLELRPGGHFHYAMMFGGTEMWGRWVFREVTPPERLVFVASFSDVSGGIGRNPWSADWPLETLSTVTFTESAGRTTVQMVGEPINASDTERKAFRDAHGNMGQGWAGTLDRLEAFLAEAKKN